MAHETEFILIGQAARIFKRPDHRVRRTTDQLWPNAPRSGRFRLIPRAELCSLAAAIERTHDYAPGRDFSKPPAKLVDSVLKAFGLTSDGSTNSTRKELKA